MPLQLRDVPVAMPLVPGWNECGRLPVFPDSPRRADLIGADSMVVALASGALLWQDGTAKPRPLEALDMQFWPSTFSPDGRLWVESIAGMWRLRSTDGGQLPRYLDLGAAPCGPTAVFTPDSRCLILSGAPATCVVDVTTGQPVMRVAGVFDSAGYGHNALTGRTDFSKIASFGSDGQLQSQLDFPSDSSGQTLVVSPGGDRVALSGATFGYGLYDAATGALLTTFQQQSKTVPRALFSGNGAFVLLGDRVLSTADGSLVARVGGWPGGFVPSSLANDGKRYAAVSPSGVALLIDVESGALLAAVGGAHSTLWSIALSPDGKHAVTASGDALFAWHIAPVFEDSALEWAADTGNDIDARYSPDGSLIAVSGDGRALLAADGGSVFAPPPPVSVDVGCSNAHFAFSPDGRFVAGGGAQHMVDVFDVATHARVASVPTSRCDTDAVFSADGAFLATSGPELYSTADWSRLWPETVQAPSSESGAPNLNSVLFMPDGRTLLVSRCQVSDFAHSTQAHCQREYWTIGGRHERDVSELGGGRPVVSADGRWLAIGANVTATNGSFRQSLGADVLSIAFAANTDIIAGNIDGSLTRYCFNPPKIAAP